MREPLVRKLVMRTHISNCPGSPRCAGSTGSRTGMSEEEEKPGALSLRRVYKATDPRASRKNIYISRQAHASG